MWRVGLQRAVKEVRFVVKQGSEHHGTWFWINKNIQQLGDLNPNTFFQCARQRKVSRKLSQLELFSMAMVVLLLFYVFNSFIISVSFSFIFVDRDT